MKTNHHHLKFITCTLLILLVISMLSLKAQDYLLSFEGTGESTTVTTVKVENLSQGKSMTMNGSDILHLMGVVTGIETIKDNETSKICIYPNPMKEYARMQFVLPETSETIITLHDLSGRKIVQTRDLLSKGQHTYDIQGIEDGIYFVRINSGRYTFNGRLICTGSQNRDAKIVYENTMAAEEKQTDSKGMYAEIVMQYTSGDLLKITAISGIYSTVIIDVPTSSKIISFNYVACTDGNGNNYPVVKIGTQTWMTENLKTTKFNDGTAIALVANASAWAASSTPGYCWYNNDATTYKDTYGALYNWYVVDAASNGGKNLCPAGWHVSTDPEWTTLTNYLGGVSVAGGKLKEPGTSHWYSPNTGATNESGFTALPAGDRSSNGTFWDIELYGSWWSSTQSSTGSAWDWYVGYADNISWRYDDGKQNGFSIRCIKDYKIDLRVLDATSWTLENQTLSIAPNAIIKLYTTKSSFDNNLPDFTTTSDANGMVQLNDLPVQNQYKYILIVEKSDLRNIKDGYIIGGVFNNQADIDSWPTQAGAYIGGLKYIDVNGDGIISSDDRTWYDLISLSEDQTITKTVIIGK
ncbi:MAG: T9SS type A sorting domain-containing protein [Bacteroidales bacterium]|nr:T9SS type A sorting domain-containing protein [Bacteroidales bacterium]